MPSTTSIFNLPPSSSPPPKIHVTHTTLSNAYLDPTQPPTRRPPFRQIRDISFIKSLRICLPGRIYDFLYPSSDFTTTATATATQTRISPSSTSSHPPSPHPTSTYSKAILTLTDILSNHALRTGNHIMLAEPHGSSVTMRLDRGVLTLEMPRQIYERTGIVKSDAISVVSVAGGGRKHEKGSQRVRVVVKLREPGMVRGRKGFDRLVWAAGTVEGLREGRVWIVARTGDLSVASKKRKRDEAEDKGNDQDTTMTTSTTDTPAHSDENDPLLKHYPVSVVVPPKISSQSDILIPRSLSSPVFLSTIRPKAQQDRAQNASVPTVLPEDIHELIEYLSLLFLQSPRIEARDEVDPYISRYRLPDAGGGECAQEHTVTVSWTGLISDTFVMQVVVDLIRRSRKAGIDDETAEGKKDIWAAVQIVAHRTEVIGGMDGYTILLQGRSREMKGTDGDMEQDSGRTGEAMEGDRDDGHVGSKRGVAGFTHATCLEFVDSVVH